MAFKNPPEIALAAAGAGEKKAALAPGKAIVGGFLAGAYIAFAGMLAVDVSAGLDPARWGGLITLFTGTVFALGLVLVVIAGSELLTGNMTLVPLAALTRRTPVSALGTNVALVLVGNLLGSLVVAYFLAVKTGVLTVEAPLARLTQIAEAKGVTETEWQIFLRAVGCNWLVCLAVWMALGAEDIGGKVLAIFFPIMAFVALGFDHVVANMFFLPAAIFAGVDGLTWWDAVHNWIFAFLGNFVGAGIFVAGAYWYLYLRDAEPESAGGVPTAPAEAGARFTRDRDRDGDRAVATPSRGPARPSA